MDKNRFKQLLESMMGDVKPLIMEQPTDCSKLKEIPKSGRSDLSGGGIAQSVTWKEDIIKIGNAANTYMFDGELLDAMITQKKCNPAKPDSVVTYSEFKRKDGTSYTMIGID